MTALSGKLQVALSGCVERDSAARRNLRALSSLPSPTAHTTGQHCALLSLSATSDANDAACAAFRLHAMLREPADLLAPLRNKLASLESRSTPLVAVLSDCDILTKARTLLSAFEVTMASPVTSRNWDAAATNCAELRSLMPQVEQGSPQSPKPPRIPASGQDGTDQLPLQFSAQCLAVATELRQLGRKIANACNRLREGVISELLGLPSTVSVAFNASSEEDTVTSLLPSNVVLRDTAVLRAFRLLSQIGESGLAVRLYADFLARELAVKCSQAFDSVASLNPTACVHLLTKLFENVATLIDKNTLLVRSAGKGQEHLTGFIELIHATAITQSLKLLEEWFKRRRFRPLASLCRTAATTIDGRELDVVLSDAALILRQAFLYRKFLAARYTSDKPIAQLSSVFDELASAFPELEAFYFFSTARQAVAAEFAAYQMQTPSAVPNSPSVLADATAAANVTAGVSVTEPLTCIDDFFYLLKKCTLRAISTCAAGTAADLLREFQSGLDSELVAPLEMRSRALFEAFKEDLRADTRRILMKFINSTRQIAQYSAKFVASVQEASEALGMIMGDWTVARDERARLDRQLDELESFVHARTYAAQTAVRSIFDTFVKLKLVAVMQSIMHTDYTLCEDAYMKIAPASTIVAPAAKVGTYESVEVFLGASPRFASAIGVLLGSTKREMNAANYNYLVMVFAEQIEDTWIRQVSNSKFTYSGVLFLERDVKSVMAHIYTLRAVEDTESSESIAATARSGGNESVAGEEMWIGELRARFARLNQMLLVLKLYRPSDIYDFWGPRAIAPVRWVLDAALIRDLMARRIDLADSEEIGGLELNGGTPT